MDNSLNCNSCSQENKGVFLFHISTLIVCLWGALYFISMNIQYKYGIMLAGYTKELVALLLALCILKSDHIFKKWRIIKYPVIITIALGWFWGINDPFSWDGIQTAGRSLILFTDGMDYIGRFSFSYVIIGILLKYIRNYNWIVHLYIMAIGGLAIYLIGKKQRHSSQCRLTIMMAFVTPHLYILSKWVYLDIPVIAFIVITLIAFDRAIRKNSIYWSILTAILLIITSLMKEIGFIACIPILILLPFQIRKKGSLKLLLPIFLGVLASLGIFAYVCHFYRSRQPYKSSDVDWLLFNKNKGEYYLSLRWFFWAVQEHFLTFMWWGWLIFALIGLVRPKGNKGFLFLLVILTSQILSVVLTRKFHMDHYFPLSDPHAQVYSKWILFFIFSVFIAGCFLGFLRLRRPKRSDLISWIIIIVTVFIFSAMGKSYYLHSKQMLWITIDWRYIGPAIPFLVILAAKGVGRALVRKNPGWFRFAVALTVSLCLMQMTLRSSMSASYYCKKARLAGEAYQAVALRPEKVVYTHWPFYWKGANVLDLGELTWKSDGKNPRRLITLNKYLNPGQNVKYKEEAIALQSSDSIYFSYVIWELFPNPFFDKSANINYLMPFNFHLQKAVILRIYGAKVQFPSKQDGVVNPEAENMIMKFESWTLTPKKN